MKQLPKTQLFLTAAIVLVSSVSILGQIKRVPPPDFVRIAEQPDSPVVLTLMEGFEPSPHFNPVNYSLKNRSTKAIRSLVITGFPKDPHHSVGIGALPPGSSRGLMFGDLSVRRQDEVFTLSVDFVIFRDGSTWGPDATRESDYLFGYIEGQTKFYKEIKSYLDLNDTERLRQFFVEPHRVLQAERRTRRDEGIASGYAYWLNTIRFDVQNRGDLSGTAAKVSDLGIELGTELPLANGSRRIGRIAYMNEPLTFVGLKVGSREILFDKEFTSSNDWLKDLSVAIRNNSGKTIVHAALRLDFLETWSTGNPMMFHLYYGTYTDLPQLGRPYDLPVINGEAFRMVLNEKEFESLKRFLAERQPLDLLSRVTISIERIHYDDRTGWSLGSRMKQDPENPKRWIPIEK